MSPCAGEPVRRCAVASARPCVSAAAVDGASIVSPGPIVRYHARCMPALFIDVFIDPNPNVPGGCGQRFKSEGDAAPVSRIDNDGVICRVEGWSSANGGSPLAASSAPVEDSGGGIAILIFGGDWGLRLVPEDGGATIGEPYLLLAPEAILG